MSTSEIMKRRLEALNNKGSGEKKTDSLFLQTPNVGEELEARILSPMSEDPFCEVMLHRFGGKFWPFMSLTWLGESYDPVKDMIKDLWADWRTCKDANDTKGMKELQNFINKLDAKPNYYLTVLVRGQEDQGPKMLLVSKTNYELICKKYCHRDFGSLHDPKEGFDIIIRAVPSDKIIDGRKLTKQIEIDFRGKSTPLAKSDKEIKEILSRCPNMLKELKDRMVKSFDEVSEMLNKFIETTEGEQDVKELDSNKDSTDKKLDELLAS